MDYKTFENIETTGKTYRTKEYGIFRRLEGNREILASRVSRISKSISSHGYIYNPIVVNENLEVIDGQGRLEALKIAGLPVDFVISPNAGLNECIAPNAYTSVWTVTDYIDSYCEMGNDNYIRFNLLLSEYSPPLPLNAVAQYATGYVQVPTYKIKNGTLTITDANVDNARFLMNFAIKFEPTISKTKGGGRYYYYALGFAIKAGADIDRLISVCANAKLEPAPDLRSALDNISDLYNWHMRDSTKKMYFFPLYEETQCKKLGWYEARWAAPRRQLEMEKWTS